MNTLRPKIDYDKSTWQYQQGDDMFMGGTYAQGEMCMKRPEMPEGFIDENKIIGNKSRSITTSSAPKSSPKGITRGVTRTADTSVEPPVSEPIVEPQQNVEPEPIVTSEPESIEESTMEQTDNVEVTEEESVVDKKTLLATPDWKLISNMVQNGTAKDVFSVGDTFQSTILYNNTNRKYPWIVAGFRDVMESDTGAKHNAMILIAKYAAIVKLPFDNGGDNSYEHSIIRQYLNSESSNPDWFIKQQDRFLAEYEDVDYTPEVPGFISCLPEDFANIIKPASINSIITKMHSGNVNLGNTEDQGTYIPWGDSNTTFDRFWIPSITEMNAIDRSNIKLNDHEDAPLEYFVELSNNEQVEIGVANTAYKMKRANSTSTAVTYWTRSPKLDVDADNIVYVCFASNGAIDQNPVTDTFAILPMCAIY